jgi:hypothetical protein
VSRFTAAGTEADGSLCGATALRLLSRRMDSEAARAVFKISGLE